MPKTKVYAIIVHVGDTVSESKYESAFCEKESEEEAIDALKKWLSLRIIRCDVYNCSCKETNIIFKTITRDIVVSGALKEMVEVK